MRPPKLNASVVVAILICCWLATQLGCNADPRARREMALLRAEILDLEDQFYSMKARYQDANDQLMACQGHPAMADGGYVEGEFIEQQFVDGEIVDEGYVVDQSYVVDDCVDCPPNDYRSSLQYSGRYLDHAEPDLRGSARRIFGRTNSGQPVRSHADQSPAQRSQRRGLGLGLANLFRGRGPGWFGLNRSSGESTLGSLDEVVYDPVVVHPPGANNNPVGRSFGDARSQLASTKRRLKKSLARKRETLNRDPLDVEIEYGSDIADEDSYDDGDIVFDDELFDDQLSVNEPELDTEPNVAESLNSSVSSSTPAVVASVAIDTGAKDVDAKPGDDGLVLLIQPKDASGRVVNETGDLTVSLIDPSAQGDRQRIGLWKFTPEEITLFQTATGGYLLRLPWDRNVPTADNLLVYVRYWTSDGRRLESSSRISIQPPAGDYSPDSADVAGWTRRSPDWNGDTSSNYPSTLANDPVIPNLKQADEREFGRSVKATPASSKIKRPAWRPTR